VAKKKRRKAASGGRGGMAIHAVIGGYPITHDVHPSSTTPLPRAVQEALPRLYALTHEDPARAVVELRDWIGRYPDAATLYNYLAVTYTALGDQKSADAVARENFERNPDYLFARLNHAHALLMKRDAEGAAEVLRHRFELRDHLPGREVFHRSEFVGFTAMVGLYHAVTGNRARAEEMLAWLEELDPDLPAAAALREKLYPPLFESFLDRVLPDR
jgi:tetratricopeptide (TPR) repeat protein